MSGSARSSEVQGRIHPGAALFSAFSSPVLVLHDGAAHHNIALMAEFCRRRRVAIAPHAKTTMTPYLMGLQIASGAWGMTAASMRQARLLVKLGVRRVLLANEVVETRDVEWLVQHLSTSGPEADFLCYVDSIDGLTRLESQLARTSPVRSEVGVLVELGYDGGRTGIRSVDAGLRLARAVTESRLLRLRGVAGYEGLLPRDGGRTPPGLRHYLADLGTLVRSCRAEGFFGQVPVVSAGGSSYFDVVVEHLGPDSFDFATQTILRSGCYVVHDHGLYHETSPLDGRAPRGHATFAPALELIGTVLSRPEENLAIVNFGRRHVPTDDRLPVLIGALTPDGSHRPFPGAFVRRVDDEHCYLVTPSHSQLSPGDRLAFGLSHPCGAFDRWRAIPVVDERYRVLDVASPLF